MNDWDLRKLQVLRALDEHKTVRAAAESLRMTPSAVSQQLSTLARQAGVELLESHGRRVRLTEAARVLLRHADAVFAHLERAEAELAGFAQGEAGDVHVGAFATAIPNLVVPAAAELHRTHPQLQIRAREAEAADVYDLLASGDVDLALSLAADTPPPRDGKFERIPLLADPLHVALPVSHRLATVPELRLADLAEEPWIFGSDGPWRDITMTACVNAGFVPEQRHIATDWPAILSLVEAGMGVALVPRLVTAEPAPGVAVRVLRADHPRRHVVAAVRAGARQRPQLAQVLRALETVAHQKSKHN